MNLLTFKNKLTSPYSFPNIFKRIVYLFVGSASTDNFFIDRGYAGGQLIIGHNTPRPTGSSGFYPFTVYDNASDRHLLFACKSKGSTGGQEEVIINEGQEDVDFRWESDTSAYGVIFDAANGNVTINADTVSANYDLGLCGDGVLMLKETTTPTADTNYGKIYTKNDNLPYFQDGAGVEHFFYISGNDLTITDAKNIVLDTTTGTKIGTATNQKLGFYNATPVVQPLALTAQLTTITHTAPGTPDYAIQDMVDVSLGAGWAFADHDEANTVLSVIANLQTRVSELETRLQSLGLLA